MVLLYYLYQIKSIIKYTMFFFEIILFFKLYNVVGSRYVNYKIIKRLIIM